MKNMTIVNCPEKLKSETVRGKLGQPNGYGQAIYGVSKYGDDNELSAIYQMRPREAGAICVKMKFYTSPETAKRLANPSRPIFKDAVFAWQGLSEEEKSFFNVHAQGRHMSGYNLCLREYLLTH